jgi:2-amino-4-hydroxy-6-hydroxymethyldihydropteridine diphosphokinase
MGICVEKISSIYETKPMGVVDQPDFLNLVIRISTELSAHELLARGLQTETKLGRVRGERWGPRTIDIDVLWYDGHISGDGDLILPHPRMRERVFVLVPLAEIEPDFMLGGERIETMLAKLDQAGLRRLGPLDPAFS